MDMKDFAFLMVTLVGLAILDGSVWLLGLLGHIGSVHHATAIATGMVGVEGFVIAIVVIIAGVGNLFELFD